MVDEACLVIILWAEIPDAMIRFRLFLHGLVMFGPLAGALSHEIEIAFRQPLPMIHLAGRDGSIPRVFEMTREAGVVLRKSGNLLAGM